jgi:hypothetical protein
MRKNFFISFALLFFYAGCMGYIRAQQTLPTSGGYYLIKNQNTGATYIGGNGTGNDAVKHENASTNPLYHYFLLTGDNTGGWTMQQVYSGLYVTHDNDYSGTYAAATGTNRQLFKFDNTTNNSYIIIQRKRDNGNFENGIGYDNTGSGSTLYFDKGTDKQNKWLFEDATADVEANIFVPRAQADLNALIAKATALYDDGGGTGADALNTAITTANGFTSATSSSEITIAIANLQTAMDIYSANNPTVGAFSGLTFSFSGYDSQTFSGTSYPNGWSGTNMTGNVAISDKIAFSGTGSGNRGAVVTFPGTGNSKIVYIEYDLAIGTPNISSDNAQFYILQDNGTVGVNRIFNLYLSGTDAKFHLANLDNASEVLTGTGTTNTSYTYTKNGDNSKNASTITTVSWANNTNYKIKAILDFTTHKIVKMTIADVVIAENLNFLSSLANNASKIMAIAIRQSGNVDLSSSIDNFEIGELIPTNRLISGDADLQTIDDTEVAKTYTLSQYQTALGIEVAFPVVDETVWTISDYDGVSSDIVSITKDEVNQAQAILKTTHAVATDASITISATTGSQTPATKSVTLKAVDLSALKTALSEEITVALALDDAVTDSNPYLTSIISELTAAISLAQGVYNNAEASAIQINNAINALQAAETTFDTALTAYDDFVTLIAAAQYAHDNETGYGTADIKTTLQAAIDAATNARTSIAVAAALASAASTLQDAIDAFNVAPRTTVLADFETVTTSYSDNGGCASLNITDNPSSTCLNHTDKVLSVRTAGSTQDWWKGIEFGDNWTVNTSTGRYLHILMRTNTSKFEVYFNNGNDRYCGGKTDHPKDLTWFDYVIDLTSVANTNLNGTTIDFFRIAFSCNEEGNRNKDIYIDEIILSNDAAERQCINYIVDDEKTSAEYLAGNYSDIIFEGSGQLIIDSANDASGLKPFGVVKVKKQFDKKQWYAVGFPFAIASVRCDNSSFDYDLETYKPEGEGADKGDYWLRTYDSAQDAFVDYSPGTTTLEAGGYVLQVPENLDEATLTFTSESGITLSNSSDLMAVEGQYALTYNSSVANLSITPESPFNYYCYGYTGLTGNFGLLDADYSLKPFESLVVAKSISGQLRSSLNVEQTDTPTGKIALKGELPIAVHYYNLMGLETQQPVKGDVYLVKKIYKNQANEITKIIF